MRILWWVLIAAGVLAIIGALVNYMSNPKAPLNPSGYTYPSSPGA